jgi:hypothetical protein
MDELMEASTSLKTSTQRLCQIAKPPLDGACLLFVCEGAEHAFAAAMILLTEPNGLAISVHAQLKELVHSCREVYTNREIVDVYKTMNRRLHPFPAWGAMAKLGELASGTCTGVAAALGVNLGLAWAEKKQLAGGYMAALRKSIPTETIPVADLLEKIQDLAEFANDGWSKQLVKFLPEFWESFDSHEHPPRPEKTFDEKALSEWKGRAAFASYRRRAAVLDKTCMSMGQIASACRMDAFGGFHSLEEHQTAMWLIGFSGLNAETVYRVPIIRSASNCQEENWTIRYNLETDFLLRDYSALASDSATPEGKLSEPASYICPLPAPTNIANFIHTRCVGENSIQTFGDLIPGLRTLKSEWPLFPSFEEMKPSWARWGRTMGPLMRQLGVDNFLTGIMVGDLGQTAKSKMYYTRVHITEIWSAAQKIYAHLGWGEPVATPQNQIAFGSQVVPSFEAIRALDASSLNHLERLLPGKHSGLDKEFAFHNKYILSLGFRFMVRFTLRSAKEIALFASIDEACDDTVDLEEKSSADRKGGIAALITDAAREEIQCLRAHCKALLHRLQKRSFKGAVMDWLAAVANHDEVPLLMCIDSRGHLKAVGTNTVLKEVCGDYRLADDFGRKWNENAMRLAGCRTGDIDRMLRHEVAGQETTSSVADASEAVWIRRTKAVVEPLHQALFPTQLHGLRKE